MNLIIEYTKYYIVNETNDIIDVMNLLFNMINNIESISSFLINKGLPIWHSYIAAALVSAIIFLIGITIIIGISILTKLLIKGIINYILNKSYFR